MVANCVLLLLSVTVGSIAALTANVRGLDILSPAEQKSDGVWSDFRIIVWHNASVLGLSMAGALTLGIAPVLNLVFNGFAIGHDVASLIMQSPSDLVYLAPHLSLEMVALTLATLAAEMLSLAMVRVLVFGHSGGVLWRAAGWCTLMVAIILVIAAGLEAGARNLRIRRGLSSMAIVPIVRGTPMADPTCGGRWPGCTSGGGRLW